MFPEAGGSLLEHYPTLIDNEGHNLGLRTLHVEMNQQARGCLIILARLDQPR